MLKHLRRFVSAASILYLLAILDYLVLRGLFGDRFWWLSLVNTFAYGLFLPLIILLPLALLTRGQRATLTLLPVMLVGALWFTPYYLPKHLHAPGGTTLKVLTANVWGNNHDLRTIEAWIAESGADIVLMQEISPAYAGENLPDLLDLYPYQANQADNTRWGSNTTLSRYPVQSIDVVDLGIPDQPTPVRMVVDVAGQPVAVYNVHLAWPVGPARLALPVDNFYLNAAFGFNDRVRNQQIEALLRQLEAEPHPFIVGGDFNMSDHTATYQRVAVQMHDSFREAGTGLGKTWPVSTARGMASVIPPLLRLDYLWHSDHFHTREAQVGPFIGSDHLPVLAVLELSARQ